MNDLSTLSVVDSFSPLFCTEQPLLTCFTEGRWRFDYCLFPNDSSTLLIFFPSALTSKKRHVPSFHRWSWAKLFNSYDVLCLSDPTLWLDEQLLGGWMQGTADDWVLLHHLNHIARLVVSRSYKRVVFCGSSLGAFVALQAATLATSKKLFCIPSFVYAENPQISLLRYWIPRHMNLLAKTCYEKDTLEAVAPHFLQKLDVVILMQELKCIPEGLVVTKESDTHHHDVQLAHLRSGIATLTNSLLIEVIPAYQDQTGHTPLKFQDMKDRLLKILTIRGECN